jgi:hypothetical protein
MKSQTVLVYLNIFGFYKHAKRIRRKRRERMKKFIWVVICSMFFLNPALQANAQESSGGKDWSFFLAPLYIWGLNITGDMTVRGIETEVDADFSDIWDNLNGVFTVHLDVAWKET